MNLPPAPADLCWTAEGGCRGQALYRRLFHLHRADHSGRLRARSAGSAL